MDNDIPINDITSAIIGSAFDVRNTYGRLMVEGFYEKVMEIELRLKGLQVVRQVALDINHKGIVIPHAYYADTIVNGKVVVEYKAEATMGGDEFRQLMTYLKLSGIDVGLLINFGAKDFRPGKFEKGVQILKKGIYRVVNNYKVEKE